MALNEDTTNPLGDPMPIEIKIFVEEFKDVMSP